MMKVLGAIFLTLIILGFVSTGGIWLIVGLVGGAWA